MAGKMEYVCRSAWLYLIFSRISRTHATSVIYIPIVVEFIFAKKKKKKEIDGETIKGVESYLVTVWKGFGTLSHVAWTAQTSTLGNPFWNDV